MEKASAEGRSRITSSPGQSETTAQALTAQLDRLHYESDATFARTTENESDRALRRIHAAERDTKLRDDKLLSLTQENIEKLVHEQVGDSTQARKTPEQDSSSSMLNQGDVQNEKRIGMEGSRAPQKGVDTATANRR
jgi:hypothetical protein